MSGFEYVVAPLDRRTEDNWVNGNLVALLAALYLYVWRGVTSPGRNLDAAEYMSVRKRLIRAIGKARVAVTLPRKATPDDEDDEDNDQGPWTDWHDITIKDLDTAALRINRHGWLEMDWAAGIDDLVRAGGGDDDEDDGERGEADGAGARDVRPEVGQIRRADTMFQDRYDYLSERKLQEYAIWKEGILQQIKEMERGPGQARAPDPDAMVTDEE